MKKKTTSEYLITINNPCQENFDGMTLLPGGRFCGNCNKSVVDFTSMSEQQVLQFLLRQNRSICGRMRTDMVNRPLRIHTPPRSWQKIRLLGALVSGLAVAGSAAAQQAPPPPPPIELSCSIDLNLPDGADRRLITGRVTDEKGQILIGTTIALMDNKSTLITGTISDVDGRFSLQIPTHSKNLRLEFSYMGYEKKNIPLANVKDSIQVQLAAIAHNLPEVQVVAYGMKRSGEMMGGIYIIRSDRTLPPPPADLPPIVVGQVYPNPFTTELHVRLEGRQAGAAQFHLFDAAGRLVLSRTEILQEGMQTVSFGLNDYRLPGGVYYLRVSDAAGEISTHPVVRVDD